MTDQQRLFLAKAATAAEKAHHVFPQMAACEAALESGFGRSGLAEEDNNLFGMKQHQHPEYGTQVLPTKEFLHREWITVDARWIKYPSWDACFLDRMTTLARLAPAPGFEHYQAALEAKDPETYIREVSSKWSTDPNRAAKVLSIYRESFPQSSPI